MIDVASMLSMSYRSIADPRTAMRAKWANNFDEIAYCSKACRSHKPGPTEARFESTILEMLRSSRPSMITCEDVEAKLAFDPPLANQRERCRQAARRLAGRGEIEVVQQSQVVDPSFAKGVMWLRLCDRAGASQVGASPEPRD